jgi:hypothetical protein
MLNQISSIKYLLSKRQLSVMIAIFFLTLSYPTSATLQHRLNSATAMTQRPIEPVRISLAEDLEGSQADRDFNEHLRNALSKFKVVVFTSSRFDCKVLTATTPITERGRLIGYSVAIAVMAQKANEVNLVLHIETGPTLDGLAVNAADYLMNEVSLSRRGRYAVDRTSAK